MKTFQFILVAFSLLTPTVVLAGPDACNACTEVIDLLHLLWGEKTVDDCLGDAITFVCETLKIEDNFVCQGIVGEFKDEFFYVAGRLIVEPAEICGLLIKECGSPILELNSNWTIPIPGNKPSVTTPVLPDPSKPKLRVLHITDIHIDPSYTEGTEADCTEPECCRVPKDTNDFARRNIKVPAPKWGYIGNCDTPYPTLENMLQHIAATEKNLDYIVVSGDLESHADENYSHEGHIETVKNISNLFKFYFPNTKSYFAVGNHE
uniref:Sphingomyelin phosphodiesterase n=1 Tax=Rhabditophanes sp. KR3021 TaxID=114890 RepID=A0AC35TP54_9BILA